MFVDPDGSIGDAILRERARQDPAERGMDEGGTSLPPRCMPAHDHGDGEEREEEEEVDENQENIGAPSNPNA